MSILASRLAEVTEAISSVEAIDPAVLLELERASRLAGGLDSYVEICTTPASAALTELARRTQAEDWGARSAGSASSGADLGAPLEQEMLSGHVEGKLLQFLVRMTRARFVLEIGMFTGYSALAMAEALPADGELLACELDPFVAEFARDCFALSPSGSKISVRVGAAAETLGELTLEGRCFDLVFIDADKASYVGYLDAVLAGGLLASDGFVCVDNTLMQGLPYLPGESTPNSRAIAEFNRRVADDPGLEQVLLPVRDGLTLIRRV